MDNIYMPKPVTIVDIKDETPDVRTLRLLFKDERDMDGFTFVPGQFGEFSVFGVGECPFCISSSPTKRGYFECTFKLMGKVTSALRDMEVGEIIGFRGPYGNGFPIGYLEGKDLLFIGGGIGMAPLRSLIDYCLDNRDRFGDIFILNGARSISDMVYKDEMREWGSREDVKCVRTVDALREGEEWDGEVGLVPAVLERCAPSSENAVAIVCGPPIMIKFTLISLEKLGFPPRDVITTLENKMKCGLGKCGRCNVGPYYVCKDGPVFTAEQLRGLPPEY